MENYLKYLNKAQQKKVENFELINNLNFRDKVNVGDRVKYIKKRNLLFRDGGRVEEVINENVLRILNTRYKSNYLLDKNIHIILRKKNEIRNKNEILKYILSGINNNTIKITKK